MATTTASAVPLRREADETTDSELVARVRAGDDLAFERLYRRYHRRIASYVQGMVHDHARAEDVTQDVFMSALRRMRDTDRPIAFKPWIYEIAKNACIDQFRRSRRAEEVSYDAEEGLGSSDYGRLVTKDPSPDVRLENKQSLDHLRGAFGGLSETHHQILVMRELEGLSYREIGERLGMTRPAVESTLFRARRRLTEEYEQLVTGERCQRVQQIISAAEADGAALGARDRRRLARHVSYCQPCLRHARIAGIDGRDLVHKPVRQKIAALLPLPAFLRRRWGGGGPDAAADPSSTLTTWSAHAGSVDPGVVSGWGKAAATAATIALAGVGAGVATHQLPDVRAAVGGASALDRMHGGGGSAPARAVAAPPATGAGATTAARRAARRTPTAKRGSRATTTAGTPASSGAGGALTTVTAGAGTSSTKVAQKAGSTASAGSGVTGSDPTGVAGQATATTDPVRETVSKVTGALTSAATGTSAGTGTSSGTSTSSTPLPSAQPVTDGATQATQDVVGTTTQAAADTVDQVGSAVQGTLGGQ